MKVALLEASKAFKRDEVPVGAVIVKNKKIIAKAYNKKENKKDATFHAEIIAIKKAAKKLDNWRLDGCTIYVTLEPCVMCFGAILNSRIKKIVYGCREKNFGFSKFIDLKNININIESGILDKESKFLLQNFFKELRNKKA
jgi:tRNA(adenine34) deaminase